jgi:hypothetical protein
MMDATRRLGLPHILASQAQKEVTHNEALELIDILLHALVFSVENNPPSAVAGDCYIVGTEPTDVWKDRINSVAYYRGDWNFIQAFEGLTIWVRKEQCHYVYNGNKWTPIFSFWLKHYPSLAQNNTAAPKELPATDIADNSTTSKTNINNTGL